MEDSWAHSDNNPTVLVKVRQPHWWLPRETVKDMAKALVLKVESGTSSLAQAQDRMMRTSKCSEPQQYDHLEKAVPGKIIEDRVSRLTHSQPWSNE